MCHILYLSYNYKYIYAHKNYAEYLDILLNDGMYACVCVYVYFIPINYIVINIAEIGH